MEGVAWHARMRSLTVWHQDREQVCCSLCPAAPYIYMLGPTLLASSRLHPCSFCSLVCILWFHPILSAAADKIIHKGIALCSIG